ncbi:RimK family alpha-L-glutamate ligase [Altererythrobacter sp. GH1-8]|uniref:ATP-grasp domain-containing protein n=1 Tax=Altererythrobacter sp. GH1-8 TaxID=3349333 RepID=UPI00374DB0F9
MTRIGFLACEGTLPGSARRREDAYEHDLYIGALEPALRDAGHELEVIDWESPLEAFARIGLILLGTVWDYQDKEAAFLAKLDALEASGAILCNGADVVRWNIDKRYLAEMAERGVPTVPTLWVEEATAEDVERARRQFASEQIVAKRQVGAGAEGQFLFGPDNPVPDGWKSPRPMMLQPFLPAIQSEGEYSFIFIDGAPSHVLNKRAAVGDYRIQSLYGGTEVAADPTQDDITAAQYAYDSLPFPSPLYARIDMVRGPEGNLLLIEAELIEPYLYPEQGPELGVRLANGIAKRLEAQANSTT